MRPSLAQSEGVHFKVRLEILGWVPNFVYDIQAPEFLVDPILRQSRFR